MPASHPRTGRTISTVTNSRYQYNPVCGCEICANNGTIPDGHAETGHAFCYGLPHVPPVSLAPWRKAA
jgi:hypothetical protein